MEELTENILPPLSTIKPKRKVTKKSDKNYVNNAEFTKAIGEWAADKRAGNIYPMSDYIGQCFMKIVTNYGYKRQWSGYTWLDDMRSDALLVCIKYAHNFNAEKSSNAFAYFTQVIDNSFKNSIKKEKAQQKIKFDQISDDSPMSKYNYDRINLYDESAE